MEGVIALGHCSKRLQQQSSKRAAGKHCSYVIVLVTVVALQQLVKAIFPGSGDSDRCNVTALCFSAIEDANNLLLLAYLACNLHILRSKIMCRELSSHQVSDRFSRINHSVFFSTIICRATYPMHSPFCGALVYSLFGQDNVVYRVLSSALDRKFKFKICQKK